MVNAVKKAEDENKIVLRVHEYSGSRKQFKIKSDLPIYSWQECDLMERGIMETIMNSEIKVDIKPYEIKTFLVDISLSNSKN
jgi:alpha-mannosidase